MERHGPIPAIFTSLGEHAFRELEAREVAALLAEGKPPAVVSLGGGAILDTGTQQLLANCTVVFLDIDVDTVRPRIIKDTGRPLLAGDPVGRWTESSGSGGRYMSAWPTCVLDTRGKSQQQLLAELKNLLEERHEP